MHFDPLDGASAGDHAFTVPEQWETGAGGIAAEDIPLLELPDETLAVWTDSAPEL